MRFKKMLLIGLRLALLGLGLVWATFLWVEWSTADQRFETLEEGIEPRVTLVLGTAARLVDGRHNLYFLGRMDTAAELFYAGKVSHFILSGDNSRHSDN